MKLSVLAVMKLLDKMDRINFSDNDPDQSFIAYLTEKTNESIELSSFFQESIDIEINEVYTPTILDIIRRTE